ncbi:MAG: LPXTG cell wall anchor domain-containing protein [Candidatus Pacearchaeota archaeon]
MNKKNLRKINLIANSIITLVIFTLITIIPIVSAAKIYGNIYDAELRLVQGAIVKINTTPEQRAIVQGNYSFDVPLGTYLLEALYKKDILYTDSELIKIDKEGDYRIDLILFETSEELFANDTELNEILDIISVFPEEKNTWYLWLIIGLIILVLILAIMLIFKRKKKKKKKIKVKKEKKIEELLHAPDKFKLEVSRILEKEKRMLQKDLRKKLGVGEAKLSLLISELEEEGKVKKIKRGRGNILIWQE